MQTDGIAAETKRARTVYMKFRFTDLYETPNFCPCDIFVGYTRTVTSQGKRETCK